MARYSFCHGVLVPELKFTICGTHKNCIFIGSNTFQYVGLISKGSSLALDRFILESPIHVVLWSNTNEFLIVKIRNCLFTLSLMKAISTIGATSPFSLETKAPTSVSNTATQWLSSTAQPTS